MDEEDGRPGSLARKFGPADVLGDVFVGSLCRSRRPPGKLPFLASLTRIAVIRDPIRISSVAFNQNQFPHLISGAGLRAFVAPQAEEKQYENVPRK
jgi:hypothetical protein